MKILKLKLFQESTCYKKPFANKIAETYPLPPYSTVIGMSHKILQAQPGQYFPMNVSIQGDYENVYTNYQNLRMFKKDKVTSMPRNILQLLNVNLVIHIQAEDEVIDTLYSNIIHGVEPFSLGRNEDLVRVDEVKIVEKVHSVEEKETIYPTYLPEHNENYEEIEGIKYRLTSVYTKSNENMRVWEKVNVKYINKDTPLYNVQADEDGDCMFFYQK